ncbi:hypothetical protein MKW92_035341 [Papaver armeniacum]|nr:hypothetical protein MKW92_035341 [Papaver armeniacum]
MVPEPFILFPEDVQLPDINDVKEERALVIANNKLQLYWQSNSRAKRLSLGHFLKLEDRYFPAELFQGKKKVEYNQSKGFSHQNKDQIKFDKFELYENLERKSECENPDDDDDDNPPEDDNPDDDNVYGGDDY